LTLVEMASAEGGFKDASRGMKSRIYHWGQNLTPPAGVPQMPTVSTHAPAIEVVEKPETAPMTGTPAAPSSPTVPTTSDGPIPTQNTKAVPPYPLPPEAKLGPIQVETAKPSNWHESWGKADDHRTNLTDEKITQATPTNSEPQAVAGNPPPMPISPPSDSSNPSATSVEQVPTEVSPDIVHANERVQDIPKTLQPAGYSHINDRPGIADVTDIAPASAKAASGSKTPVMDFLRTLWKPPLKEPAPLQTIQVAELPVTTPAPSAQQFQRVIHDSLLPSEREMAVEAMSGFQREQDPTIVPALLRAAADDPAASVRAACVHGLVRMNANTLEVVNVLMNLKADPDLRVRREVHQAFVSFGLAKPEPENEMIHQISAPGVKTVE